MLLKKKDTIKILHVFGRMQRAGAELRTLEVMRQLDKHEFQLHFCALSGLSGELDTQIVDLGGKVFPLNIYEVGFSRKFKRLLRYQNYDVVHSHVHYPSGYLLWLAHKSGVPVRITHFRNSCDGRGDSVFRQIQRYVLRYLIAKNSTHILAVSLSAMNSAWRDDWSVDKRCQVIYNGIDTSPYKDIVNRGEIISEFHIPVNAGLYIHVGRFDKVKNHTRLLTIFSEIAKYDSSAYLLLVGRRNEEIERQLKIISKRNHFEDKVIYAGVRSDVPSLLKSADMMIFPSLYEGLPGAVLEASAAGLPVLASDLPVIREISSQLPLLQYLPLDCADKQWARMALDMYEKSKDMIYKQGAINAFKKSEFNLNASVRTYKKIWSRGRYGIVSNLL